MTTEGYNDGSTHKSNSTFLPDENDQSYQFGVQNMVLPANQCVQR
jgi:hypothetical protein